MCFEALPDQAYDNKEPSNVSLMCSNILWSGSASKKEIVILTKELLFEFQMESLMCFPHFLRCIVCAPTSSHNVMHSVEMPFLTCATLALPHYYLCGILICMHVSFIL